MKHTWPDGTPKSTGNAFDWQTYPRDPVFQHEIAKYQNHGEKSTRSREAQEAAGINTAVVNGLRIVHANLDPKQFHIYTQAGHKRKREFAPRHGSLTTKVLDWLKANRGPIFPEQIDRLFHVDRANQASKLQHAVNAGWLRKVHVDKARGYALGEAA